MKNKFFCFVFTLISSWSPFSFAQNLSEPFDLKKSEMLLESEVSKKSCTFSLPTARSIYAQVPTHLKSLQVIADCTQSEQQDMNQYTANETKEIFEQSRILSIVPKLLEMAQVKDLVPILREVEVKKDKNISDYLMINEIYERMDEPEKQIASLKEAIKNSPDDPQLLLLLASKQFDGGQREEAEGLFKTYAEKAATHQSRLYLMAYVLALAYPQALSLGLVLAIWFFGFALAYRKTEAFSEWKEAHIAMPLVIAVLPPLLAFRFWQTGKALPLGALLIVAIVQIFFLLRPILSIFYGPILGFIGKIFYFVFNGTLLAKKLGALTTGSRALISFLTLVVLGTIAPTIESTDIKYGLIVFSSLILYATIGSLMVTFMRSRESLLVSLRWLGIAATFPFLISYLVANWSSLGAPFLVGQVPSHKAIDSFASYLIFWGVSLFLALHLSKIVAEAVIQPITEIINKVAMIEKGAFEAKVEIISKDEIGHLGSAINRMGSGLGKREKIEKTFRKYVDAQVAERILNGVETELRIEGESVNAVILFVDIRGFTKLSEKTPPKEIVHLLNHFFEKMVRIIQDHNGIIDKFIGDNMMAVWGVPCSVEDAEQKAIRAALLMIKEVSVWNEELKSKGLAEVGIGIGINTGNVIAGSIGSSDRMEYTVIGDTVNTAQRCESVAKRQQVIVTGNFYSKLEKEIVATALEPIKVKGKEELQHWWSVTGLKTQEELNPLQKPA